MSSHSTPLSALHDPAARRPARARRSVFRSMRFNSLLLLVVLLAAWEFGVRFFEVPKFLLPPFSDVAVAMYQGLATGPLARDGFWFHSYITLVEILLGFFVGSAIGLLLGIVISELDFLEVLLRPYIAALQSLPKVAVAPIIVMWMGFGIGSKVAIVSMLTFFPVLVTSIAGFKAIDLDRIDLLRSLSATRWQIFVKAKFPSALPYIFAGLDMAAAFSVVGAVVGEFIGAQAGLGVLILQMDARLDTGGSFAVFVILSLIGVALTGALRLVRRRVLGWMPVEDAHKTVSA
ncbi:MULTISPECIES: ABC transporter permease [unclassified Variovorax]|uniref:ABC transporter permease n=1 Tax=unclassified Variovorax TaxID=663243 RepID=UPI0008387A41|nr:MULTISPECIES: ABC transporter permease [unclassified Variovorax]PNG59410.1 putative aliphatic sulfonates transport permease protein SsuC [Variovorax sp. B4]PNG60799.1 putative aliphatic sulfonates transport permease protein SsuC [Variovorax sp. B2]VTV13282.1 Putative aliphatic sulfonates transport permease protein SsuC [Variovorax sp. WDL1]